MEPVQIQLATLWFALMLTYLLGDVLRIFAGDFKPGRSVVFGQRPIWMAAAFVMLIPIVMAS